MRETYHSIQSYAALCGAEYTETYVASSSASAFHVRFAVRDKDRVYALTRAVLDLELRQLRFGAVPTTWVELLSAISVHPTVFSGRRELFDAVFCSGTQPRPNEKP